MLRTIAITLVLLLSVGVMLPFANSAHGIRQSTQITKKKSKRYRSRAWWRRYRARLRAKRAAEELARRNAMMAIPQNLATALPQNVATGHLSVVAGPASPSVPAKTTSLSFNDLPPRAMRAPATIQTDVTAARATRPSMRSITEPIAIPPVALVMPVAVAPAMPLAVAPAMAATAAPAIPANATVSAHAAVSATRPRVVNAVRPVIAPASAAKLPGQMNLSIVALSRPNPIFLTQREQKKMLAGVPVADLKRIVIDKMVNNGGWVVNDFIREVNGARVFVVTGRTPKDALTPEKAWTFYFTESDGRVYGLTTESPVEYAERMTIEAERFIQSLRAKSEGGKE
ncbi:MAG TPA: hypothetical protein VFD62_19785 [Pyrinomonadaceae bacterium]|nr:hypothetical protein [Pyrinomonadaceae bacterium]